MGKFDPTLRESGRFVRIQFLVENVIRYEYREDAPRPGYSVYNDWGYLVDVLQPIIDARDESKTSISVKWLATTNSRSSISRLASG